MANTRDFSLPAIWASSAQTITPVVPVIGQGYRRESVTNSEIESGHSFNSTFDANFINESYLRFSQIVNEIEKLGILAWSDLTNYTSGTAIVCGSNGLFYESTADSGPPSPQDPVTTTGFWSEITLLNSLTGNTSGIYRVSTIDGAATVNPNIPLPSGFTVSRLSVGRYRIIHNMNNLNYVTIGSSNTQAGSRVVVTLSNFNAIVFDVLNDSDTEIDAPFEIIIFAN